MLKKEKWTWTFYDSNVKHTVELNNISGEQKVYADGALIGKIEQKNFTPNYEYCFDIDDSKCVIFISLASTLSAGSVVPKFIVNDYYVQEYEPSGQRKKYFHVPEKDIFGMVMNIKLVKIILICFHISISFITLCNLLLLILDIPIVIPFAAFSIVRLAVVATMEKNIILGIFVILLYLIILISPIYIHREKIFFSSLSFLYFIIDMMYSKVVFWIYWFEYFYFNDFCFAWIVICAVINLLFVMFYVIKLRLK